MSNQYASKSIDHLGLVSGLCEEIGIVEFFDNLAPKQSHKSKISFGQLFLAMILNGLGLSGIKNVMHQTILISSMIGQ